MQMTFDDSATQRVMWMQQGRKPGLLRHVWECARALGLGVVSVVVVRAGTTQRVA
jgi:hypothetical protein